MFEDGEAVGKIEQALAANGCRCSSGALAVEFEAHPDLCDVGGYPDDLALRLGIDPGGGAQGGNADQPDDEAEDIGQRQGTGGLVRRRIHSRFGFTLDDGGFFQRNGLRFAANLARDKRIAPQCGSDMVISQRTGSRPMVSLSNHEVVARLGLALRGAQDEVFA